MDAKTENCPLCTEDYVASEGRNVGGEGLVCPNCADELDRIDAEMSNAKTEQEAVEAVLAVATAVASEEDAASGLDMQLGGSGDEYATHAATIREGVAHIRTLRRSLEEARKEMDALRIDRETLVRERKGEVWIWQNDGSDDAESLACPVLMQPEVVRWFVAATTPVASPSAPEQESEGCGREWAEKRDAWVARVRAEKNRLDDSWSGSKGVGAMGLGFGEVEALLELLERASFAPDCSAPASSVEGTDECEHCCHRFNANDPLQFAFHEDGACTYVSGDDERDAITAALQRRSGVEGTEGLEAWEDLRKVWRAGVRWPTREEIRAVSDLLAALRTRGRQIRDLGTIEFNDGMDDDDPAPQSLIRDSYRAPQDSRLGRTRPPESEEVDRG